MKHFIFGFMFVLVSYALFAGDVEEVDTTQTPPVQLVLQLDAQTIMGLQLAAILRDNPDAMQALENAISRDPEMREAFGVWFGVHDKSYL